jgi:hypothetical protein
MNIALDPLAYVKGLSDEDKAEFDRLFAPEITSVTTDDPEWRIDNIYWVQDENGQEVRFVRNEAQRRWWAERWDRNCILKARQLGFSTAIGVEMLDTCLFRKNTTAGIIDYSLDDAKKKLGKIKFTYSKLPEWVLDKVHRVDPWNTETITFSNGSRIEVGTSHRGGTLQHLHVSEYGKISAVRPDKAKEIKTGGFGTVHKGQRIDVESTAEGIGGEFYDLVQRSDAALKEARPLSQLDFRFHFFAWWQHPGYRLEPRTVRVTAELLEYFDKIKASHKITLDDEQRAWYAAQYAAMGPNEMYQEYPSYAEEAFHHAVEGAYFKRQMTKMRLDGRICHLPFDENRVVNTFWDIGNDTTFIIFHQTDGMRHRLIDCYANADESMAHYAMVLRERAEQFGWKYGRHYGPHDLEVQEWGNNLQIRKSRRQMAQDAGLHFSVIPRIDDKNDSIDAARMFLAMCWIDETHCEPLIRCLDNYRKKWNEQLATWSREPLHDWASHGADSLQTGAMGYRPEKERKGRGPNISVPTRDVGPINERGTGWMGRR